MKNRLFAEILGAVYLQNFDWSDTYIQPGLPMMLRTPSGNRIHEGFNTGAVSLADIEELSAEVWKVSGGEARTGVSWRDRVKTESIKEAIDIESMIAEDGQQSSDQPPPPTRLRFIISSANGGQSLSVVVRKTPQAIPTLESLGFPSSVGSLTEGVGLVLVTGPTGNAKSTTVAAFIEEIRTKAKADHIVQIADPLEFIHPSTPQCVVTPRQVGIDVKNYTTAAEDALRMAPRVIEFGEIRDTETALAALMLGESGHLVFTTMQASTVEGAITKLMTLTAERPGAREAIATCLKGVVRPALIPSKDGAHWEVAHEFVLNEGAFKDALEKKPDEFPSIFRANLRSGALNQYGVALNKSLNDLVTVGKISPKAAITASNDIDLGIAGPSLKLK